MSKPYNTAVRPWDVLAFVKAYMDGHDGIVPSLRDIAAGCDISLTKAHSCILHLERQGHITRHPGIPRSIRISQHSLDRLEVSS
jgi:hypothetical protein